THGSTTGRCEDGQTTPCCSTGSTVPSRPSRRSWGSRRRRPRADPLALNWGPERLTTRAPNVRRVPETRGRDDMARGTSTLASPDYPGTVTKKLLLDLIRARMALEAQSVADAVQKATAQHLREMRRLLNTAGQNLADDDVLNTINMSFHRQIALASGNAVLV